MPQPIAFEDSTARFSLPFLFAGQAQKEFFVNEAHALTDILVHTAVRGSRATPPNSPVDGDIWLIEAPATGPWENREDALACLQSGVWTYISPREGMRVFDESTSQFVLYSDSWVRAAPPPAPNTGDTIDSELRTAFDDLIQALRNAGIFPVTE